MRAFIILILLCWVSPLWAAPNLGVYIDVEGVRVYQDHEKANTWYLSPATPVVSEDKEKGPDFGLEIYRYLGSKGTGDQNLFRVRGIFQVNIERETRAKLNSLIRKKLKNRKITNLKLRSMPVSEARIRLLFGDQSQTWSQGSRWGQRSLMLPLDIHMAELLWEAVSAGQTQVSLVVEETLDGVRQADEEWQEDKTATTWTLPLPLDMEKWPAKFRRTDIGGRMVRGYTGLDIFCFDFAENLDETLYAKVVEVAIPLPGRDLVKEVTFRASGDCRTRIEFELSKDLDRPYRFRVTRVFNDGRKETGPWLEKSGNTLLDVTDYREAESESEEEPAPAEG
ncbi:MAG: hypothetical protein JXK94_00855 [Deltaproteobacteria bacterium]|nr:hypothetical protein [Deltaproteobacteria bacterium]